MQRREDCRQHWATLVPALRGTPAIRLVDNTEMITPLVNQPEPESANATSGWSGILLWITRLPLRPAEALLRVDNCDGCEVWLRRIGRQGRRLQPGQEVVFADNDVVVLRTIDQRCTFGRVAGCALDYDAPPAELRWRFEREESVVRAMAMLCDSTPWLGFLSQSAPTQCSLDAQAVLLRVSTGAAPVLAKAAALAGESGSQPEGCEAKSSPLPHTPSQPVFASAGGLLSTPAPKIGAGNGWKRKRD